LHHLISLQHKTIIRFTNFSKLIIMKTKFFLLVSLVLLAVQGWAAPPDSSKDELVQMRFLNYSNESNQSDGMANKHGGLLERKKFMFDNRISADDYLRAINNDTTEIRQLLDSEPNSLRGWIPGPFGPMPESVDDILFVKDLIEFGLIVAQNTAGVLLLPPGVGFQDGTVDLTSVKTLPVQGIIPPETELEVRVHDPDGNFFAWATGVTPADVLNGRTKININYHPKTEGIHAAVLEVGHNFFWMHVLLYGEAKRRTINVSTESVSFPNHVVEEGPETQSITVSGENLKGSLTVDYDGPEGVFTVNKSTITAQEAMNGTTVDVTYNPQEAGRHNATITISGGNAPEAKTIVLSGLAEDRKITVSDNTLTFSNATLGTPMTKTFTATGTNLTGPMNVQLDDQSTMFSIRQISTSTDQNKTYMNVTVGYTPTALGTHTAEITVSGGGARSKTVHVLGTTNNPTVTVDQTSLDFNAKVGQTVTQAINVTGTDLTGSISLLLEETEGGQFSISRNTLPANGGTVIVTFKPTETGTFGGRVRISADGAASKSVTLNGHAYELTVTPTSLDYGTVIKGESVPQTFEVTGTNLTGPLTLTLSGATGMYYLQPATISAADAAAGKTVQVTYHPTEAGTHIGTITISGGGAEDETVSLTGRSVIPTINVNPASLDFETIEVGKESTMTINVTGSDLTGSMSVLLEETEGGQFSINRNALPASGGTILVTFKPTEAGTFGGRVKISGGGAVAQSVTLTGSSRELSVYPTSLNFGTVNEDASVPKTFTVTGSRLTGPLTLTLSGATGKYTISPTTISAAEAAAGKTVTVTYTPGAGGTHNGTVTISGGGVEDKTVSLTGKCAAITPNTTSLVFDPIEAGKTATKTINVTGTNLSGSITVLLEETISGQFSINKTSLPASGGTIIVTFKPTEAGAFSGRVRLSADGAKTKSVSLTGSARELVVSPTSLNFGTTAKNVAVTKKFTVTGSRLSGPLTLALSGSTGMYTISTTTITAAQAANGVEVSVTYKPTSAGTHNATVTISGGGVDNKTVSLTGKCAVITASPTSLDFGTVDVGTPVPLTITVTGTNLTSSMTVALEETEGGQYSINRTSLPASGGTIIVTFKPTSAGTYGGRVRISGGNAAAVSVSLTGKGKNPTPVLTVSPTSLSFHEQGSKTFTVKGSNLTGNVTLTLTGNGKQYFTVSPTTISKSAATSGATVTVTCNPTAYLTNASAAITISSSGATSKTVSLSFASTRGSIYSDDPEDEGDSGEDVFTNGSQDAYGDPITNVYELQMGAKVYAKDLNIIIESPIEQSAVISDIAGHAWNVDLQKGLNEIPVNARGIYLIRIREKTTKLLLK